MTNKKVIKGIGYGLSLIFLTIGIISFFKGRNSSLAYIIMSTVLFTLSLLIGKWNDLTSFKKGLRIIGGVFSAVLITLSLMLSALVFNINGHPRGDKPSDYETRILLYEEENVPGNSKNSKLDDMEYQPNKNNLLSTLSFTRAIVGNEYRDEKESIDTFTYGRQIRGGYEKDTYEDIPYLIPYLKEGSDSAVIIISGGGYGYKSLDGEDNEAKDIAKTLNDNGISAFVLWYRSNPYYRPIPQLDVQRAVRYVRYHAKEYHIDHDKISMIGFSAGGNQVGSFINLVQGKDLLPSDYIKDDIDMVDDYIHSAAMIYPAVSYNYNVPMLFASYPADLVRHEESRQELLDEVDLIKHFNASSINQFISYGTADIMVEMDETIRYINKAKDSNTEVTVKEVIDGNHGYPQSEYMSEYLEWIKEIFNY